MSGTDVEKKNSKRQAPPQQNTLPSKPTLDEIFEKLQKTAAEYLGPNSIEVIEKAYRFSAQCHIKQKRRSGDPYIIHPLEVSLIVADLGLDTSSIVAALLHDTVEDTDATLEDITREFDEQVSELVDGLTKIAKIKFRSNQEKLAKNFRKMIVAMARDLRVIVIKLADRLHNMRTLGSMPHAKACRIAQETLDIYAPLANRLGIYGIKSELEDLCLRTLKKDVYQQLRDKVSQKRSQRQDYIEEVVEILENALHKYGFNHGKVYGRPKHFYSIYKKMIDRHLEFEDVHDLFAFRIIVDDLKDCYEALGVVHSMWKPMPGRFKDYIAMPKANMYQSLHTTVIRPNGDPIEIQIRTKQMHDISEFGVAAHWQYKETGKNEAADDLQKFSWLRQIVQWQSELQDPDEFLEALKVDLFDEEMFLFTPKADVISLPKEATALDFAFAVHTKIGLKTSGAKVNGRMVPIKKKVQSGDIVEILTSTNQRPKKDWLNYVTTTKARNKIRAALRSEQREQSKALGKELLLQELQRLNIDSNELEKSDRVETLIKAGKQSKLDDIYVAIGYGKLTSADLTKKAFADRISKTEQDSEELPHSVNQQNKAIKTKGGKDKASSVIVSGLEGVLASFAKCCNPLPGETIVGFVTRGKGVTVHRSSCPRAIDLDPHRKIEVTWPDQQTQTQYVAYLRVTVRDDTGVLANITNTISNHGVNIRKADIRTNADLTGVLDFELGLNGLSQLQGVISKLESQPSVVRVERRSLLNSSRTRGAKSE
jgi:GTP diphosphokinase / guanosine-3',5'-bis(diphosphate) 3'-diphosphatase